LIFYRAADGAVKVEVLYQEQTFWLNQKKIAELFGVEIPTINYHLKEIYASGELVPEATIRNFLIVQTEGKRQADWIGKLNAFLQFNEYEVLSNAGSVSAEVVKKLAEERIESFRVQQDKNFVSDFEQEVKRIEKQMPEEKK
jgi:hypothetical protein